MACADAPIEGRCHALLRSHWLRRSHACGATTSRSWPAHGLRHPPGLRRYDDMATMPNAANVAIGPAQAKARRKPNVVASGSPLAMARGKLWGRRTPLGWQWPWAQRSHGRGESQPAQACGAAQALGPAHTKGSAQALGDAQAMGSAEAMGWAQALGPWDQRRSWGRCKPSARYKRTGVGASHRVGSHLEAPTKRIGASHGATAPAWTRPRTLLSPWRARSPNHPLRRPSTPRAHAQNTPYHIMFSEYGAGQGAVLLQQCSSSM